MSILTDLKTSLCVPVIGAPMYIASNPALVTAQCKAGIVGAFPSLNARPQEELTTWLSDIKADLTNHQKQHPDSFVAPFAVNQICHQSNARLRHDMEICVEHEVPIIITSLRPPAEVIEAVHGYGGVVMHDVISIRHAEKALEQGVDGLIAVTAGAGGHAGTLNPLALVGEIRRFFDGPLALSGAISTGDAILAAQAMGADFAYLGTRFLGSTEANIDDEHKQMICAGTAKDIVYTPAFSGVHGSYLAASIKAAGVDLDTLDAMGKPTMEFDDDQSDVSSQGPKAWRDIWSAGHGIGMIEKIEPTAKIVERLEAEYHAARTRLLA
jgi:nitronate monooxygenase